MYPLRQVWFGNGYVVVFPTEVGVYVYAPALAGFPGLCNYRIILLIFITRHFVGDTSPLHRPPVWYCPVSRL